LLLYGDLAILAFDSPEKHIRSLKQSSMKPILHFPASHSKGNVVLRVAFLGGFALAAAYVILMFLATVVNFLQ